MSYSYGVQFFPHFRRSKCKLSADERITKKKKKIKVSLQKKRCLQKNVKR